MHVGDGGSAAKGRLLEAAGEFSSLGYAELSVAQILSRAGVQAPTLYHHFGDKEGLFTQWAAAALERMGEQMHARPTGHGFAADLAAIADAVRNPENPDLMQLSRDLAKLQRSQSRETIVEALQRTVYEPVYASLMEAMAAGRMRSEPLHATAAVFLTGATALRPAGLLSGASESSSDWWVARFLSGFGA